VDDLCEPAGARIQTAGHQRMLAQAACGQRRTKRRGYAIPLPVAYESPYRERGEALQTPSKDERSCATIERASSANDDSCKMDVQTDRASPVGPVVKNERQCERKRAPTP